MPKTLVSKISEYTGDNSLIKELKQRLSENKSLTTIQIKLAERFFKNTKIEQEKNKKASLRKKIKSVEKSSIKIDLDHQIDFNHYNNLISPYSLYEHQRIGVEFLYHRQYSILADDMGLGKSMTSIVAALETKAERVVVVVPANLRLNYQNEILKFEKSVHLAKDKFVNKRFVVLSYEGLEKFSNDIIEYKPEIIIADEAHYLKNTTAKRTNYFNQLSKIAGRLWLLTGTPIGNRPIDFYNLLNLVKCSEASNYVYYGKTYCDGKWNGYAWDYNGASNMLQLHERIKNIYLRRLKKDCLDLPDKIITPISLELTNRKDYLNAVDKYLSNNFDKAQSFDKASALVELSVLRKFLALEKIKTNVTFDLIDNVISHGKKVIVFTNYKDVVKSIITHYGEKRATYIVGGMSGSSLENNKFKFQSDPNCQILVGNLKAAGSGHNLTAAEVVIMNDLDWVPLNHSQAEDRAYRIGQMKDVVIYYPLFQDTLDTELYSIIQNKQRIIELITEGKTNATFPNIDDIAHELHFQLSNLYLK